MIKNKLSFWNLALWAVMLLVVGLVLGTIGHEVLGHGSVMLLSGESITKVKILFFTFDSGGVSFVPEFTGFGYIWGSNNQSYNIIFDIVFRIMGSGFNLIVSLIFLFLILLKKWKGFKKILFICLAVWFIDAFCNYVLWPYVTGGGSDFEYLYNWTGFNLIPFSVIVGFVTLVGSAIVIYRILNKENKKFEKIMLYALIIASCLVLAYFAYLVIAGSNMQKNGISECDKIGDSLRKDNCIYSVALYTNNESLCALTHYEDTQDYCYGDLAYYSKNSSLCQFIIDDSYKQECLKENKK